MKRTKHVVALVLLMGVLLTACGGSTDSGNSEEVLTQAAQIAMDGLTQTAAAAPPTSTNTPEPTATNTVEPTPTFTNTPFSAFPTAVNTQQSAQNNTGKPCWRGNLETETIPDGSEYFVGRVFTKTWRIKNTGTCTWPADTVASFVGGDLMGATSVVTVTNSEIAPNEYLEVSIDFQTPSSPGTYKSNWMLRGGGAIFGVGQTGLSFFWVEIEAKPINN
jgi:hypothetical protein